MSDVRAVRVVWQRELIRFAQDKIRIVAALVQPVLFLFVLGTGLQSLTKASTGGIALRTFMFPGVIATGVLFTAMFSAVSIVWDREFGFLREMLVAPVRRGSILVGKCLGGATVATFQGILVLILAPLVGVSYDPLMIVEADRDHVPARLLPDRLRTRDRGAHPADPDGHGRDAGAAPAARVPLGLALSDQRPADLDGDASCA